MPSNLDQTKKLLFGTEFTTHIYFENDNKFDDNNNKLLTYAAKIFHFDN